MNVSRPTQRLLLILLMFGPALGAFGEAPDAAGGRIAWWREARLGLFIHWGLYSIPGRDAWVQWDDQIPVNEYAKLADRFQPDHFDPNAWAATARDAGMKYVVLTSRHHDGFALFDSDASDFTSTKSAAHRDFVADYVRAVRAAGLRVGLYYSPLDWRFPGFFFPDLQRASAEAMRAQYHRQIEELLTHYGQIDVLWFDGGEAHWLNFGADWLPGGRWQKRPAGQSYHGGFSWQHEKVLDFLRRTQPDILINGRADMPPDFQSREGDRALGVFDNEHPWELCTTHAHGWGWEPNAAVRSLESSIRLLAQVVGRDGNLLLNVGPRPDGQIDPPQAARLREIGAWLARFGESIYGTRGGPLLPGSYGVSTRKGHRVYVHLLEHRPAELIVPAFGDAHVIHVSLLGGGELAFRPSPSGIAIALPTIGLDPNDPIVALDLDADVSTLPLVSWPPQSVDHVDGK